jgi:hypothetical protein
LYFTKLELTTKLSTTEILEKLNVLTFTSRLPFFKFNFTDKLFYGHISKDSFSISQVIKGKNSFVPIIHGKIIGERQNKIVLKMRLHFVAIILIVFITTFIIWFQLKKFDVVGFLFLVVLYVMTVYNYIIESKKVKQIFIDNFK